MDREGLREIINANENSDFYKFLGLQILRLENGVCELSLPSSNVAVNNINVYPGVYSSICELASRLACYSLAARGLIPETHIFNLSVYPMVNSQTITVHSQVLHINQSECVTDSKIYNERGELLGASNSSLRLFNISDYEN